MLLELVNEEFLNDLEEIEGRTSGRLMALEYGTEMLGPNELVAGVPHANHINAAFCYPRPNELNRFNGPDRGAWYAGLNVHTSIAEVAFHLTRELERAGDFNAVVDYAEMYANFVGDFVDLRNVLPKPDCLAPDPATGYPPGNRLANLTRQYGHNGIVYPSVRDPDGTCLVALWPHAVQSVAQGNIVRLIWKDSPDYEVECPE